VEISSIDDLFQLPLDQFTQARNTLAKASGKDGAAIRQLTKPPLAAWAVNQLYWQDRATHDELIDAANEMRRTHKAIIEGKRGDLRSAGREHELAIEKALKSALALLKESGHPVTEATRQSILNTLRALPADEPAGRLTKTLAPGGFEMLAGISPAAAPKRPAKQEEAKKPARGKDDGNAQREAARAREERAAAERAVRDADQKARHAEFEAARAARDAAKAARRLEEAQKALDEAKAELEAAERDATQKERESDAAARRSRDAQQALADAKKKITR
jgi:translation initiation factor IF-2